MQKPQKIRLKEIQKLKPILSLHRCRKTFCRFFLSLHRSRKTFFRFFLSLHRCRKTFCRFFLSLHRCRKTFFGFFYRFIGAVKLFSVFSITSSVKENFFSVFSVASSVLENFFFGFFYRFIGAGELFFGFSFASSVKKKFWPKIFFPFFIFFSKILYRCCFNRYIFEYRCPPLPGSMYLPLVHCDKNKTSVLSILVLLKSRNTCIYRIIECSIAVQQFHLHWDLQ